MEIFKDGKWVTEFFNDDMLKPCPFCGGAATMMTSIWGGDNDYNAPYQVVCKNCYVHTETDSCIQDVIKKWNKREPTEEEIRLQKKLNEARRLAEEWRRGMYSEGAVGDTTHITKETLFPWEDESLIGADGETLKHTKGE